MAVLVKWMLLGALAVACCACGGDRGESRPPEPLPAKHPPESDEPKVENDSRPAIAAFGDSISAGFGLDPGKSFTDDLQRMLDAKGYRYRVVNLGVSGDTTTDGLERVPSVLALKPAIVILEFGGNDGSRGLPVAAARANLARMIEALQKAGSDVVLAGMTLPRNYGPEYIRSFDQMYVDLANEYHLTRIPFLLDQVGGITSLMQPDGLHPNARGAEIVAGTAMKYLTPLLKK